MTRRDGRGAAVVAGVMSAVLWSGVAGQAQEAAPGGGPDQARAEAIRQALAVIEGQLQEHGGTWAKWSESLNPYREDLVGCYKLKWPWPAEKGYVFQLLSNDVEVVNLHEEFRQFRLKNGEAAPLFYVRDAHYLNRGAQLSAEKIAERLKRYDFVRKALAGENPYVGEKSARTDGDKADDTLLLIKDRTGQPYRNSGDSPVFVLGDSHMGYNTSTAPFSGQIAYRIAVPVSEKWKEGLAAGIPIEVAKDSNLKQRRVVVVHYSERMMRPKTKEGGLKWPVLNLPGVDQAKVNAAPLVTSAARY
jgi:hypothetical protein